MRTGDIGQGVDVGGIVVEGLKQGRFDRRFLPRDFLHGLHHRRLVARHGVVGIERHEDKFFGSVGHDLFHHVRDGRIAVAHGQMHGDIQLGLEQFLLPAAGHDERRTLVGPNRRVGRGTFARTERQDEEVENDGAQDGIDVQDARVGEKFAQVGADVGRFG